MLRAELPVQRNSTLSIGAVNGPDLPYNAGNGLMRSASLIRPSGLAWRRAHLAAAAILGEVGDEAVHRGEVGGINDLPSEPPLRDEARLPHVLQMKGQGRGRHIEPRGNIAGGQALRSLLDQHAVDGEAVVVGDRAERGHGLFRVHDGPATFR
jgi:hypothetical protein